ncbi:hypothetical protein SESBI_20821 [Sesbania bispinosa]|nr:hypothetical protein SESBI_20821 [Sesbania bispinosa]
MKNLEAVFYSICLYGPIIVDDSVEDGSVGPLRSRKWSYHRALRLGLGLSDEGSTPRVVPPRLRAIQLFAGSSSSESESDDELNRLLDRLGRSYMNRWKCKTSPTSEFPPPPNSKSLSWVDVEALGTRGWYSSVEELSLVFGQVSVTRPGHEEEWEIYLLGENDRICS